MSEAFKKVLLLTGEERQAYIKRRLNEGATTGAIVKEINHIDVYSGPEGKAWEAGVVYAVKRAMEKAVKVDNVDAKVVNLAAKVDKAEPEEWIEPSDEIVPDAFQGILTPEDMAEIKLEAAKNVRSAERKKARKAALAQATMELEREAALAAQRGQARGDMVDVHIDLAPYAPGITIDGVYYHHGTTPRVRRDVARVIQETCQRSWQHQDSISGQRSDFNRQRQIRMGGGATQAPFVQGAEGLRA